MSSGLHRFFDNSSNVVRLAAMDNAAAQRDQYIALKRRGKALMLRAEKEADKVPLMAEAVELMECASKLKRGRCIPTEPASKRHHHASASPASPAAMRDGYTIVPDAVYEREKYVARTAAEIYAMLDRYGVAVVPDALSRADAAAAFDDMINSLERMYDGFVFKDPSTWALLRRVSHCKHAFLFQHLGIGWAQFAVNLRQNLATIFADLWTIICGKLMSVDDLFSSADGIAFGATRPGDRGGFHGKDWMHFDQAPGDTVRSIQGGLNLVETQMGDAAFTFLEGSHHHFDDFFRRLANHKKKEGAPVDFKRFTLLENQKQIDYFVYKKSCMLKSLATLPGDLFLWDSRVVHSGRAPIRPTIPSPPSKVFLRGVVYVSMQPKMFATPADINKKAKALDELRTTTHNAAFGVTLFSPKPRTYGKSFDTVIRPITEKPVLSALGRSLFGAA
jgi:hypothetical protein